MSHLLYFLFFVLAAIAISIIFIIQHKRNGHTELYKEGVHNENEGDYALALQNYSDALTEIRRRNVDHKFGLKIEERIKILRTLIDYEKGFQTSHPVYKAF
jgi:hypothetical protein